MTYITRQFNTPVPLPDGSIATGTHDIDCYLQRTGLALAGDYSQSYLQAVRAKKQKTLRQEMFADFIHNYKRKIWYGK